jgi:hypothetical protein
MRTSSRRRNGDELKQRAAEPADRGHQAAGHPVQQRYYKVISRAVAEQGETTFSSREALYERARVAQIAALQKYLPSLSKDNFDSERQALEQAIDRVEQENASSLWRSARLTRNGDGARLGARALKLGAIAASEDLPSTSRRLHSLLSKIGNVLLILFVLVALVLSPRIFVEGVWITDTAVSYLASSINMITRTGYPPPLATYQVVYSDGVAQEIRLFPDEIERWIKVSNIANAAKHHQIVRVIDPEGRIVWGSRTPEP